MLTLPYKNKGTVLMEVSLRSRRSGPGVNIRRNITQRWLEFDTRPADSTAPRSCPRGFQVS